MTIDLSAKPRVIIFRNELLPRSETFIREQATNLKTFDPTYAGLNWSRESLRLEHPAVLLSSRRPAGKRLASRVYWRTGIASAFHRRLHDLRPALLHAHFAPDGAAALPLQKALRVPLIVTLHGYDVTSTDFFFSQSAEGRAYLRRRQQLWHRASLFLCISNFIREKAIAKGFPASKLHVHYTGTDLAIPAQTPRNANRVLFVGRLVEKKGCAHLLSAMKALQQRVDEAHLVIIGSGPEEAALKLQAERLNLRCQFLGMQPTSVVREHMASARVLCVPSITASTGDSEGLGMVFAEALAMGTPVVSYTHGGIPEIVSDRVTGLLAREGDVDGLAHRLQQLLLDDELWVRLSTQGPAAMAERFNIVTQTRMLEDIYRAVLMDPSIAS